MVEWPVHVTKGSEDKLVDPSIAEDSSRFRAIPRMLPSNRSGDSCQFVQPTVRQNREVKYLSNKSRIAKGK